MEIESFLPSLIFINLNISFLPINSSVIFGIIILLFLLILSGLISGSEVAFFSLTPSDKEVLKSKKSSSNSLVLSLIQQPERLLATILIGNNLVNIGIVILSAFLTNNIISFEGSEALGFLIKVVLITFLILLAGEIIPKVYSNFNALKVSLFMAYPIRFLEVLFKPLSTLLVKSTHLFKSKLQKKENISMDELSQALDLTTGSISEEKKLLKGIVQFGNIEVSEILKARVDVIAVDIATNFKKMLKIVIDSSYSRIPIFSGSFDDIKGVLYIKDLLPHLKKADTFRWQSLIRPPYFIPETKKINDLLREFQTNKIHMAVVIDEYGGTSGIITMEDILEEIVGEITDEFDEETKTFTKINEYSYLFDGKTLLNDFFKIVQVEQDIFDEIRGEADTLAGMILEVKGEIPEEKDTYRFGKFHFTIAKVGKRRIEKIKVTIDN